MGQNIELASVSICIKSKGWIYSFSFVLLQCLLLALYRIVFPVLILWLIV